MSVQPLPPDDTRHEELTFKDDSRLTISAQMRAEAPTVYKETCELALSRKFPTVVDLNNVVQFPKAPAKSFK
jgi:hypothetical protein